MRCADLTTLWRALQLWAEQLPGTWTRFLTRRSRASQAWSMGDMSSEYAGHGRTGTFSASRNCVQILATWGHALSCWNTSGGRWMARQWASGSRHSISVHSWGTLFITLSKPLSHTTSCTCSVVVRTVGHTEIFSKMTLEVAYCREINIQLSGNSSGGYSCSQHANCTLSQNLRHLWHCVVWQNCTF